VSAASKPRTRLRGVRLAGAVRRVDRSLALALLPVVLFAAIGWALRWVNEDGFIYFRVVDHLLAGEGPVFNAGERVEAYTSPAWLALLALVHALVPVGGLEWQSVVLGLLLSVAGLVMACLGAIRVWRSFGASAARAESFGRPARAAGPAAGRRPRALVPLGALVVATVPAFWGFETSGLETGLVFAWLGGTFLGLAGLVPRTESEPARAGAPEDEDGEPARTSTRLRRLALAVLIGLGPLVRPDLAPFVVFMLVALVFVARPRSPRRAIGLVAAALALPLAYQLFRMGYFAQLVPSTALAKEAGLAYWSRGLGYLGNLVLPYVLPLPLAILGWLLWRGVAPAWRDGRRDGVVLAGAAIAGALLHALYVVRLGGDYMHGRMLLPSLFGLLMPVAVVALPPRRSLAAALVATVVVWAGVCAVAVRTPSQFGPAAGRWQVLDHRAKQRDTPSHPHPVTLVDHDALPMSQPRVGYAARALARPGRTVLLLDARIARRRTEDGVVPAQVPLPIDVRAAEGVRAPVVIFTGSIGRLAYAAGRRVRVADRLGLADPVAARLRLAPVRERRAGHEKLLPAAWFLGRFADPGSVAANPRFAGNPRIPAARAALRCGRLGRLMRAVTAPLTPARFVANLGTAVDLYSLRVPADPVAARRELCRR